MKNLKRKAMCLLSFIFISANVVLFTCDIETNEVTNIEELDYDSIWIAQL